MTSAIRMEGVGKRYWKLEEQAMLLRSILPFGRPTRSDLWAMRNFDFDVEEGGVVGIIGRNGAGKSTLLKMMAGVTQPTEGKVTIRGRVAPLISVGVGFHQEMSGRENVYVNGMLLGLTKKQIDQRFDEIVQFAELADFIDTPVKFYSSGMFMRLGFSVAIHTDPQVLLVDEVLAVGDIAFQMKCLEKMREIRSRGVTIVMVSHQMGAIRLLCPRAIVIRHGAKAFDGDVEEAIAKHHEILSAEADTTTGTAAVGTNFVGGAAVLETQLLAAGEPAHHISPGDELTARVRVRFDVEVADPSFAFAITSTDGTVAYAKSTPPKQHYRTYAAGSEAVTEMRFTCHLGGGSYRLMPSVSTSDNRGVLANDVKGLMFFVESRFWAGGVADLDGHIAVDSTPLDEEREWNLSADTPGVPPDAADRLAQ
jgi:ABC-type polysaccharide/polyol phosphate transport system ATPase subunit